MGLGGGVGYKIPFVERTVKMSWPTVGDAAAFTRFSFVGPDVLVLFFFLRTSVGYIRPFPASTSP